MLTGLALRLRDIEARIELEDESRTMRIDSTIDFHADAGGRDPDTHSATLRRYHRLLWSKPLPSGKPFELHESGLYLRHQSELGSFWLSSDSIVPTFRKWIRLQDTINRIPQHDIDDFWRVASTIGARIVFPTNQINGMHTINQARGIEPRIADRFDLTLECIRRHYLRLSSPLADALDRYVDFFELFGGFGGYVEFFLLEDLVAPDGSVRFFKPFDGFQSPALPRGVDIYREYHRHSIEFVAARNRRIADWAGRHLRGGEPS